MSLFYHTPIAQKVVVLAAGFLFFQLTAQAQTIKGTVFNDLDANGQKAVAELGIAGVTVTAFRPDGSSVAPATTAADGSYTISGLVAATNYRIEFSNYPSTFFSAPSGSGSASSVQFATSGATNVNFGLAYPRDFCEKTPDLIVPCYSSGDNLASAVANEKVLIRVPYTNSGTTPTPTGIATAGQIGPTFGTAIHRLNKKAFTATLLKRHVGLGPGGLGAIYMTDLTTMTSSIYVKLQDIGQDVGVTALGARSLPNSLTTSSVDATAFDLVGKAGLGGLAISSDEKTLYTINLFTQKLLKINIGYPIKAAGSLTAGDVQTFSMPSVSATGGVLRPFAVDFYKGKVYVGAVATGETSGLVTDVKAYIFEFDHATGAFNPTPILTISSMDYPKGDVHTSYPMVDKWMAWSNSWAGVQIMGESAAGVRAARPQPILSDLAFSDDGDLILGFMDRNGHQTGYKQKSTVAGDTKLYNGYIGGDILRARKIAGVWTLESNGVVGGTQNGCGKGNGQGPGGGEFYCGDNYTGNNGAGVVEIHQETFEGGLVVVPGTNQLVATAMDPLNVWTGGFTWFSNTDGNSVKRYQIYESINANQGTYGKANGLGVTDAVCSPPPLELGNRVWKDTDGDGQQDANEPSMKGVTVKLYAADGTTLLATAVTDANGNFYFNSGAGTSTASKIYGVAILPETNYVLKVMMLGSDPSVAGINLSGVTIGGTAGVNSGTSLANNDATLVSGLPTISLKTGLQGENNHTYDFGFMGCILNVTAGSNSPVCENGTINLTSSGASGSATYAWTGPNGFVSTAQNPSINSATASKSGTYTVIVTDGGCKDTATVAVVVTPISASATGGAFCQNGTILLNATAAGATSFSWNGPSSFTSTDQNPMRTNATMAMAGTYTVTATTSGGCSATATATVSINSVSPTASAAGGGAVCPNGTISLSSSGGGTYAWSGPNGFVSNAQNPTISNAIASQSGTYVVTVTATNGCTGTASATVTVASPSATAGSNSPVCKGNSINLTATSGASYAWTGPNGFTSTTQNPTISNATAAASGIYTVVVTLAGGCTAAASTTVAVNSVSAFAQGGAACTGGSIQLSSSGGASYAWSGPSGFSSTLQNPTVAPAVAGNYVVTVSNNGCSATATAAVTVVGTPTASVSAASICEGGAVQLFASGGAQAYQWSGPNGWTSSQQNPTLSNVSALQSGTYTVTVSGTGCSGSPSVSVTVNAKPTAAASSNSPVCEGATLNLTSSGGSTYSWTGPNSFVSTAQNPSISTVNSMNEGTYSVTVTSSAGCSSTASTTVAVNHATATASTSTPSICAGSTINLAATGGGSYAWSGPNSFSSAAQNPSISNVTSAASGSYVVTVTTNGCTATASTTVEIKNVNATPTTNSPVCEGSMLALNAPDGMMSYAWSGPNGFHSTDQFPKINYALPLNAGSYTLTVTSFDGCTATASVTVVVNPLPLPTATKAVLCVGETINLHANGLALPMWTGPNSFSSTAANPSILSATTAQAGTYFLKNSTTGCVSSYEIIVTEGEACMRNYVEVKASDNPDPTNIYANNSSNEDDDAEAKLCFSDCTQPTFSLSQTQAACMGAVAGMTSINLSSIVNGTAIGYSIGSTYNGPTFSTATAIVGSTHTISLASPSAPTTYVIRVFNGGQCCFTEMTFTLLPSPCATATNNGPICMENDLTLSATGGGTYAWSGPNSFTSTDQNPIISMPTAGVYTVTVTVGAFTSTASTTVSIFGMPTVTTSSNSPVPYGQPIQLAATSNPTFTSYAWSGPNGFTSNAQFPTLTSDAASGGTYTVVISDEHGCSKAASTAVTTQPPAPCSVTGTIGGPTVLCEGDTLNMTASGGAFYAWSGPNGWTYGFQNPKITDVAPIHSGTYSVTVTGAMGGCTDVKSLNLLVNAKPRPAISAADSSVCAGESIRLMAISGGTYVWNGPNGFTSTAQNPTIFPATTAAAGLYFVKMTSTTGGCMGRDSLFIAVAPSPVLSDATTTVCIGTTVDLTSFISGYNSFSNKIWKKGTANGSTETTPTAVHPNTTTDYFLIVTNDAGCRDTAKITIQVNAQPIATATANPPSGQICAGATLSLLATGGGSYAWSGPNSFTSTAQNPSISTISENGEGIYTVVVTAATGCKDTATIQITVNETVATATGSPACAGGNILLAATGGGSYAWSGPNAFTSTAQNPTISNADFSKMGIYTVTVTANGCSDVKSVNIVVSPIGAAATTDAPICAGQTLHLFANNGGTSYSWTGPNSFASSQQNPVLTNATGSFSGTYNVTVSGSGGCTGTASVEVVVNPLPTPTASSNSPICHDATLILTSSGGSTYAWSGPNNFVSATQNPTILNATTSFSGTYNVTVTSAAGCSATASTAATVNQTTATASATSTSVCVGSSINLQSSGGGTYSWSGPDGFTSTTQNPTIASATTLKQGIYTVTVTKNGCAATASVSISVNKAIATATVAPVCSGGDLEFHATGGSAYVWSGPNSFSSTLQNPVKTSATVGDAGAYVVTVTDGNGCTASATATAAVNNTPTATAAATTVCEGGSVQLQSSGGAFEWAWTGPNGFTSTEQNPVLTNATPSFSGTYNVTVTGAGSCAGATSVVVTVHPKPTPSITGAGSFCEGSTVNLGTAAASSYAWSGPNGFLSGVQNPTISNVQAASGGPYFLTITDGNGCSASTTATVLINFTTTVATANSPVCAGATLNLVSGAGASWSWTGPDGFVSTTQNPSISNVISSKSGVYNVTATDANGCTATASVVVVVKEVQPTISISATCADLPVNLTATGGGSYSWSGPNGFSSNIQNPMIAAADAADFGLFSVVVTKDGCSATATQTISEAANCLGFDFGDLPDPTSAVGMADYQTLKTYFGAGHRIVSGLKIGSNEDAETTGQPTTLATGDGSDEDGIAGFPIMHPGDVVVLPFKTTNLTGNLANLYGFIDWNNDGDFDDANEKSSNAVPNGSTDTMINLNFVVPMDVVLNANLGARFRLSNSTLAASPIGTVSSGEVEDYVLKVAPTEKVAVGNLVFMDNNGNGKFGAGDMALDEVRVELYFASQTIGVDAPVAVDSTSGGGFYLFDQLDTGMYKIFIPSGNFAIGGKLFGKESALVQGGDTPNDDNADENGQNMPISGGIVSTIIHLKENIAPTGETGTGTYGGTLDDDNVNMTVDFGFKLICEKPFIGADKAVCSGNELVFIAYKSATMLTDSVRGKWTIGLQTGSTATVLPASPIADSLIRVVFTNSTALPKIDTLFFEVPGGCRDTTLVTVQPRFSTGTATHAAQPTLVCTASVGLPFIDLFAELTGEDSGGTWSKTSGPNVGINFDAMAGTLNPNGLGVGTYVFKYQIVPNAPCPAVSTSISIVVLNCCPPKVCLPVKAVKISGSH